MCMSTGVRKVPSPSPSKTLMVFAPEFVTTRSGFESPLRSPAASEPGERPTAELIGLRKDPFPLLSTTVTLLVRRFAAARSGLPSRLKSAMAMDSGCGTVKTAPLTKPVVGSGGPAV